MQPFLNMQFVEFDRERREGAVSMADPDGLMPEQHGVRPDPIGRMFIRYLDWVESAVRYFLERKQAVPDPTPSLQGATAVGAKRDLEVEDRADKAA